jgi:hypothetical protein
MQRILHGQKVGDKLVPMVNSPRAETALDDLKPSSFTKHHVLDRDANVVEFDLCVTVRGILLSMASNEWHTSYPITVV